MATTEAPIHQAVKDQIVANDERDTVLVFREFRNTARVARNAISEQIRELGARPDATFADVAELASGARGRDRVLARGDLEDGMWWAGQAQGLIHDVAPVADVVDAIVIEAEQLLRESLPAVVS